MTATLTALLLVLEQIAVSIGQAQIANIIKALENILPFLIQEFQQLVPLVKNIITALRGNGEITPDQEAQLDALEAQYDADFEAAAAAYGDGSATPPTG